MRKRRRAHPDVTTPAREVTEFVENQTPQDLVTGDPSYLSDSDALTLVLDIVSDQAGILAELRHDLADLRMVVDDLASQERPVPLGQD